MYNNDDDKIANSQDKCPEEAGTKGNKGCPDKDGDGVIDQDDNCPDEKGLKELKGCKDTDKDGISDLDEKDNGTNPKEKDTDDDGVNDKEDACPNDKGTKALKGCPEKKVEPTPIVNVDQNTLIDLPYNGNTYRIKQGFTTENGMTWNKAKWRYFGGKWQKQEIDSPNGEWKKAKKEDVIFLLAKKAEKVKKSSGNGGDSGTGRTSGGSDETKLTPPPAEPKIIPTSNKVSLRNKHEKIMEDGVVSSAEQNEWATAYTTKYKNGNYKKDDEIESWNDDID
jgi:hypothetical protein